jgi:hypothetical protein
VPPDDDRAMASYRFFRHRRHPQFRLALRAGDEFPDGAREADWEQTRERDEADTAADVLAEIADRGYSLFQLRAELDQIPPD